MGIEMSLDRRLTTRLSLAVLLTDDFTRKEEITGKVKIAIPSLELTAVMNPSGYYNFFNIAASPSGRKLQITSDYYMDMESADIIFPLADPPVYPVTLKPGPMYPFPSWATLIRGTVKDSWGNNVAGAGVEVNMPGSPQHLPYVVSTKTTTRGEFVLYFPIWQESVSSQTVVVASTTATGVIEKCKTTTISVTI